jgi:hypothetical protein
LRCIETNIGIREHAFPPGFRGNAAGNHRKPSNDFFLDSHVVFLMFNVGEYGQFNDQMNNSGQSFQMDAL